MTGTATGRAAAGPLHRALALPWPAGLRRRTTSFRRVGTAGVLAGVALGVALAAGAPTRPLAAAPTDIARATEPAASPAQDAPQAPSPAPPSTEVVVGTRVVPPFVIPGPEGTYSGLTVELWDHVASELGIAYRFDG